MAEVGVWLSLLHFKLRLKNDWFYHIKIVGEGKFIPYGWRKGAAEEVWQMSVIRSWSADTNCIFRLKTGLQETFLLYKTSQHIKHGSRGEAPCGVLRGRAPEPPEAQS